MNVQKKLSIFIFALAASAIATNASAVQKPCGPLLTGAKENTGAKMHTKEDIIRALDLKPLPGEGGYYKETYRSSFQVDAAKTGIAPEGQRNLSTAIYYLIGGEEFSALHRLKGDEVFHFYGGDPVEMLQVFEDGTSKKITLGSDIVNGQQVQVIVPAGVWQGTRLRHGGEWALLGTTMAPGFDFVDFELADRNALASRYPGLAAEIEKYTRTE